MGSSFRKETREQQAVSSKPILFLLLRSPWIPLHMSLLLLHQKKEERLQIPAPARLCQALGCTQAAASECDASFLPLTKFNEQGCSLIFPSFGFYFVLFPPSRALHLQEVEG